MSDQFRPSGHCFPQCSFHLIHSDHIYSMHQFLYTIGLVLSTILTLFILFQKVAIQPFHHSINSRQMIFQRRVKCW